MEREKREERERERERERKSKNFEFICVKYKEISWRVRKWWKKSPRPIKYLLEATS